MRPTRFFLLASVGALSACAAGPPVLTMPRLPAPATTVDGLSTAGPWLIAVSHTPQAVTLATRAVLTIRGDSTPRTDTLSATLDARYAWTRSGRRRVDGTLTGYRVAVGRGVAAIPAGLALGRPFTADAAPAEGTMKFRVPLEGSACTNPALSVLQGLYDAWVPLPDTLLIGREWSDTVRTLSCRDRLPVLGATVRRFRVLRAAVENGRLVIMIDRQGKGQLTADGEQFGEVVSLRGEHTGTMHYVLDAVSARFVRAEGRSSLDLTFKSRRRNQRWSRSAKRTVLPTRI